MNILVTGANGFLGSRLCTHLSSNNHHILRAQRKSADNAYYTGDITPETDWSSYLSDIDVIVHTAARVHVMNDTVADPGAAFMSTNCLATLNLATQAANAGVKRFIFISSVKANGEETTSSPFTETILSPPNDPYGRSKYEAEQELIRLSKTKQMEVVIIRPPLVYGPGVKANFEKMISCIKNGIPLPFGSIKNKRSFVFIDNLVDFISICLTHPAAKGEIFLVSDDQDISTSELSRFIAKGLGKTVTLLPVPEKLIKLIAYIIHKPQFASRLCGSLCLDITKAKKLLDWRPKISIEQGIEETTKYYMEHTK